MKIQDFENMTTEQISETFNEMRKDIQYLLIIYDYYQDDIGHYAWNNKEFIELVNKYGFTQDSLYVGFEELEY